MGSLTIICGKKENPEMLIDEFERYLSGTKKMSANTIEAYRRDIDAYTRFLTARGKEPDQATNTDVVAYLMDLKSAGKSRSTVNRKLASLRIFYKFLRNAYILVFFIVRIRAIEFRVFLFMKLFCPLYFFLIFCLYFFHS